jgi:hypothetical protein
VQASNERSRGKIIFEKPAEALRCKNNDCCVTVQVCSGTRELFLARFFQTTTMKKQAETHDLSRTLSVANFKSQTQRPDGDVSSSFFFVACRFFKMATVSVAA